MLNKADFHAEMVALITELIPTIGDDYRADEETTEPSMQVTVGANADGWNYQTGDNSFTGSAYSFADWAVVSLDRDSRPDAIADDIVAQLDDVDTPIFAELIDDGKINH